jgi:hypothetical protein
VIQAFLWRLKESYAKLMTYLTFPDLCSGTLKLRIALRPGAASLTVIVVKSWNENAQSNTKDSETYKENW